MNSCPTPKHSSFIAYFLDSVLAVAKLCWAEQKYLQGVRPGLTDRGIHSRNCAEGHGNLFHPICPLASLGEIDVADGTGDLYPLKPNPKIRTRCPDLRFM